MSKDKKRGVFKPVDRSLYSVVTTEHFDDFEEYEEQPMKQKQQVQPKQTLPQKQQIQPNKQIKQQQTQEVKGWTETSIKYILLKYKIWQLKDRNTMSLNIFHQNCSQDLFNDMKLKKQPNQIRHKINNTRSSFHNLLEQTQKVDFDWEKSNTQTMSQSLYNFMCVYFVNEKDLTLEMVEEQLNELIHLDQQSMQMKQNQHHQTQK